MADSSSDDRVVPDVQDVEVSGGRILVAGLSISAATMLVVIMFMVLVLRMPMVLLVAGPAVVVFTLLAGIPVGWATWRVTQRLGLRQLISAIVFFVVGGVAGFVWGYPLFVYANRLLAQQTGEELSSALPWIGAAYVASTAATGAVVGRYLAPWAATRPSLVRMCAGAVLFVALTGVALLTLVRL